MTNNASEFINNRILEFQEMPKSNKTGNWYFLLNESLLKNKKLLQEFSKDCNPTQNQEDFARSVSIHNIFKFMKNDGYLTTLNNNIENFPIIEKTNYPFPDNVMFEPQLNLNLLRIVLNLLEETFSIVINTANEEEINDVKKNIESERKLLTERISVIQTELQKTPDILTKNIYSEKMQSNKPRVSIITNSYNLHKFVDETIRSVSNQDYEKIEHIVIDAASTDGSLDLIKKYTNIIIKSEKDTGYPDGFWKGLRLARGEYITQCSVSDGYASTSWIKRCVETLDNNKDISLVWGLPQHLTEDSKAGLICYRQFYYSAAPQKQDMFNYWLRSGFHYPEGNFCVRKSVIFKCYPTVDECKEGVWDWLEFCYRFNSLGYLSMYIPTVANFARTHGNQSCEQLVKNGEAKAKRNNYFSKISDFKHKMSTGLIKFNFIDPEGSIVS